MQDSFIIQISQCNFPQQQKKKENMKVSIEVEKHIYNKSNTYLCFKTCKKKAIVYLYVLQIKSIYIIPVTNIILKVEILKALFLISEMKKLSIHTSLTKYVIGGPIHYNKAKEKIHI